MPSCISGGGVFRSKDIKACSATSIPDTLDALVEPAFVRALWLRAHARLKLSATGEGTGLTSRLSILRDFPMKTIGLTTETVNPDDSTSGITG